MWGLALGVFAVFGKWATSFFEAIPEPQGFEGCRALRGGFLLML